MQSSFGLVCIGFFEKKSIRFLFRIVIGPTVGHSERRRIGALVVPVRHAVRCHRLQPTIVTYFLARCLQKLIYLFPFVWRNFAQIDLFVCFCTNLHNIEIHISLIFF